MTDDAIFKDLVRQGLFCLEPDMAFKKRGNRHLSLSHYITCLADESVSKRNRGDAVTNTAGGRAGLGSAGDTLLGQVFIYESDGYLSVQDKGYVTFRGVPGFLPAEGDYVGCDGHGAVVTLVPWAEARDRYGNRVTQVDGEMVTVFLR